MEIQSMVRYGGRSQLWVLEPRGRWHRFGPLERNDNGRGPSGARWQRWPEGLCCLLPEPVSASSSWSASDIQTQAPPSHAQGPGRAQCSARWVRARKRDQEGTMVGLRQRAKVQLGSLKENLNLNLHPLGWLWLRKCDQGKGGGGRRLSYKGKGAIGRAENTVLTCASSLSRLLC